MASLSESASVPRRRKSKGDDGSESKIQLVSSTTPAKGTITARELLGKVRCFSKACKPFYARNEGLFKKKMNHTLYYTLY